MGSKWKVYQVYQPWNQGGSIYKVGRLKDSEKPVEESNINWEGFASSSWAEAMKYAHRINEKEEQGNE